MLRKQNKAMMKEKLRKPRSKMTVLRKYWKNVALNNILWIYLGLIVLTYNETGADRPYHRSMDTLSLLFELVSAYGTIGYSMGFIDKDIAPTSSSSESSESSIFALIPGNSSAVLAQGGSFNATAASAVAAAATTTTVGRANGHFVCSGPSVSLSGKMRSLSKVIIMVTMLAGRHRGLPSHLYHKDMREGVKQSTKLVDLGV